MTIVAGVSAGAHGPLSTRWLANLVETKLPYLFLVYALPCVVLLSVIMAPFQVADELADVERSDQISRGKLCPIVSAARSMAAGSPLARSMGISGSTPRE